MDQPSTPPKHSNTPPPPINYKEMPIDTIMEDAAEDGVKDGEEDGTGTIVSGNANNF